MGDTRNGWLGDRDEDADPRDDFWSYPLHGRPMKRRIPGTYLSAWSQQRPDADDVDNIPSRYAARPARGVHPLDDPALVADFLDQGVAWCMGARNGPDSGDTYYGRARRAGAAGLLWVPIADMETGHALNTARFILNRARDICLVLAVGEKRDIATPIDTAEFRARQHTLVEDKAREHLLDTPLVRALLARASDPPVDEKRPWEAVARTNQKDER